jgi:PAS domain S-box-containing protein
MKNHPGEKRSFFNSHPSILVSLGLVLIFWTLEYFIHFFLSPGSSAYQHFLGADPMELHMRLLVTVMLLSFGIYAHVLIANRRSAEKKAQQHTRQYQALLGNMLNGLAHYQLLTDELNNPVDFILLEANHAYYDLTGLAADRVLGCKASEATPWMLKGDIGWLEIYGRAALAGETSKTEIYSKHLNKWLLVSVYSPEQGFFVTLVEDITERKKIEGINRENQERMDTIFNSIQTGIMVVDQGTHRIVYVNPAAARIMGGDTGQLIDCSCQKYICPADQGACPITDKGQKLDNSERTLLTIDGRQIPILKTVVEAELDGRPVLVESFVDITERKRQEQALNAEAIRRRILIDQSRDGIVVLAKDGSVYESNRRFAEMLGYSPEEIKQLHVWDWEFQYTREQTMDMISNVDEAGDFFETRHRRKDGTTYDVEISTNGAAFEGEKLIFCVCRDITDRKKTEDELRKLNIALEQSPSAVVITDLDGRIEYVNNAFVTMTGYPKADAIGENPRILKTGETSEEEYQVLWKTIAGGGEWKGEFHNRRKDDSLYWEQAVIACIKDQNGAPVKYVAVKQDITERKQAEEELRASEEKFRLITENTADTITVMGLDLKITYVSPSIQKLRGYTVEEAKVQSIVQINHPAYLPMVYKMLEEHTALEERGAHPSRTVSMELEEYHKDGTVIWAEVTMSFLRDKDLKAVGIVTITKDITERRQAEEKLRASEEKYRNLVENQSEGIGIINQEEKFVFANPAADNIFGLEKGSLVGRSLKEYLTPAGIQQIEEESRQRKDGKRGLYELEINAGTGEKKIIYVSAIPQTDPTGKYIGTMGLFQDITEQKKARREIEDTSRRMDLILSSAGEGIYGLDDKRRTIFMNPAAANLLGYSVEEMIGKVQHEVSHHTKPDGSHYDSKDCPINASLTDGQIHHVTGEVFWRKDGSSFPVEYTSTPTVENGRTIGSMVVFRDITERKQNEALQSAIYKISEISTSSESLLELYAGIHMVVDEMMNTANFYIALYNEKENKLEFPYFVDERDPSPVSRPLKKGLTEYVLGIKKPLLAPPMVQKKLADAGEVEIVGTPSVDWVGVPLKNGNQAFGVLVVQSYREKVRFGARELSILNFVSDNIAAAIQRKKGEDERKKLVAELQESLNNIKTLKGLVPICSSCKKIRNDGGYWQQVEEYVSEHTEADFSHGICDECAHKLYPQYFKDKKNKTKGDEVG